MLSLLPFLPFSIRLLGIVRLNGLLDNHSRMFKSFPEAGMVFSYLEAFILPRSSYFIGNQKERSTHLKSSHLTSEVSLLSTYFMDADVS